MPPAVYAIQNLVKRYPGQAEPANRDISFEVQAGEIFGLLGANGAGKTTLVRQMVNLLRSTTGSISLFGQPVGLNPLHVPVNVGYMPQESYALNNLTVGEALYFTAHLRGLGVAEARRERDRLIEVWEIGSLRGKYSTRLSGGERRLLRLAAAMAGAPPVLVLDEPTNDLDPQRRKLVWDVLRRTNQEQGTTIIFITHDAIEAEKVIQRVGILRAGEMVALGSPGELKRRIDQKLRLEVFFPADRPPVFPDSLIRHALQPGRWLVFLDREDVAGVLNQLDLQSLDDFRLYSATLEDLYLYYANSAAH